jgi:large subunit ribosomal protein L29e
MAKSNNNTNHNNNKKAHRNGIKRPQKQRYSSLRGVDQKFLRNQRFAKRYALKPSEQRSIDRSKFRKEQKLVKAAMIDICRVRRLVNKNKNDQQKKSADERKKLWKEAKKAGKTIAQFEKELREKAIALLKENSEKNKAERKKAKEEKAKAKAEAPKAAATTTAAATAESKLSKTKKKRAEIRSRREKDERRKINFLALRRIKYFENRKSNKLSAFKKSSEKQKRKRLIIKTQLYNELRERTRERRTRRFANQRIRDALKKVKKAREEAKAAGKPYPRKAKKEKKESKAKAKFAKPGKKAVKKATHDANVAKTADKKATKDANVAKAAVKPKKKTSKKTTESHKLRENARGLPNRLTPPLKVDGKLKKTLLTEIRNEKKDRAVKRKEKKNKNDAQKKVETPKV